MFVRISLSKVIKSKVPISRQIPLKSFKGINKHCVTPDRRGGECIPIEHCSYLYDQISDSMTQSQRNFLLRSKCGYIDGQIYICCEKKGAVLPLPPQCGLFFSDRILKGNRTAMTEYPWLARLVYTTSAWQTEFFSGGTLINDRYVLTAAHCAIDTTAHGLLTGVRLGEWDTARNPDYIVGMNGRVETADPHVDVLIESVISHPDYQPGSSNKLNDIALLRLKHKVRFSDYIQPVCLPSTEDLKNRLYTGKVADVVGWGQTETSESSRFKLKATLTVMNPDQCKRIFANHNINIMPTHICAGGEEGIDSCGGDSGGPLLTEERVDYAKFYFLIGVVSIGANKCGSKGYPGVYTRVSSYIDWIERNIQP